MDKNNDKNKTENCLDDGNTTPGDETDGSGTKRTFVIISDEDKDLSKLQKIQQNLKDLQKMVDGNDSDDSALGINDDIEFIGQCHKGDKKVVIELDDSDEACAENDSVIEDTNVEIEKQKSKDDTLEASNKDSDTTQTITDSMIPETTDWTSIIEPGTETTGDGTAIVEPGTETTGDGTAIIEPGTETTDGMSIIEPIDPSQYRVKEEPMSNDEDDSSSDSSSSEEDEDEDKTETVERTRTQSTSSQTDKQQKFVKEDVKTKGELYPEELPPIEDLAITVDESVNLVHIGDVVSVVGILVVVQSNQNMPPLNEETVVFLEGRVSCGKIFEVFGPVASPWYSLRFNSTEDISTKGVSVGTKMFCAPKVEEYTNYVFVEHLKQIKGSDASWEDNNEPPQKFIEYSDDEEEKRAKAKKRNKKQDQDGDQLPGAKNVRRRKHKQAQESCTDTQTTNTNSHPDTSCPQRQRQFAPFGGQHNKFQTEGPPNQHKQRFPPQNWQQPNNQTTESPSTQPFTRNVFNYENSSYRNNKQSFPPHVTNSYNSQPMNSFSSSHPVFQPDFTKPPPNFYFGSNLNSSKNDQSTQNMTTFGQISQNYNANGNTWQENGGTSQGMSNTWQENGGTSQGMLNTNWNPSSNESQNNTRVNSNWQIPDDGGNFRSGPRLASTASTHGNFSSGSFTNSQNGCPHPDEHFNNAGSFHGHFSEHGSGDSNIANPNTFSESNSYNTHFGKPPRFPPPLQNQEPHQSADPTHNEAFPTSSSVVDSRFIQKTNYNQPQRQPQTFHHKEQNFGERPQHNPPNQQNFGERPQYYPPNQHNFGGRPHFHSNQQTFGGRPQFSKFNKPY